MITKLSHVTILVRDQEEALRFYMEKLGFVKRDDESFGPGARWLTISPPEQSEVRIVLWKPLPAMHGEEGAKQMLAQVGQSTHWVFSTKDCRKTYETLSARGVKFMQTPTERPYGVEAIFEDLYGNHFVLTQPK